MFRWGNRSSHLGRMKNSSYYIALVADRTHDLPHTVASNMVKVSHALNHSWCNGLMLGTGRGDPSSTIMQILDFYFILHIIVYD